MNTINDTPSNLEVMNNIINSSWIAQCTCVITKLGIPDFLSSGSKSAYEIAKHTNCNEDSIYRIMRLLSEVGIFSYNEDNKFSLSDLGDVLRTDHPHSLKYSALYLCSEQHWATWGNLIYSIQTGNSAFEKLYGKDYFSFLSEDATASSIFNECMKQRDKIRINHIINFYDFSRYKVIVDIGSGKGELLLQILKHNPLCKGVLFEKHNVIKEAFFEIKSNKLLDRCRIVSGNFFNSIPQLGDLYILSSVLHDWNDNKALKILQNCRNILKKSQKLLIIEKILDDDSKDVFLRSMDIEMLTIFGGKERTLPEFKCLLSKAGLCICNIYKLEHLHILECELKITAK